MNPSRFLMYLQNISLLDYEYVNENNLVFGSFPVFSDPKKLILGY